MNTKSHYNTMSAKLPNTIEYSIVNEDTKSLHSIQIGYPLDLKPNDPHNIIYLVDGNAYFSSSLETIRRSRYPSGDHTILVGIGYEGCMSCENPSPFDPRRSKDLTLPRNKDSDSDIIETHPFLSFVIDRVTPSVDEKLAELKISPPKYRSLMGHSFGGLFTLTALVLSTKLPYFDTYAAVSPSVWFNDRQVLHLAERYIENSLANFPSKRPQLLLSYGTQEQYPARFSFESDDQFKDRRAMSLHHRMSDNAMELENLLTPLVDVDTQVMSNANHGMMGSFMPGVCIPWILEKWELSNTNQ